MVKAMDCGIVVSEFEKKIILFLSYHLLKFATLREGGGLCGVMFKALDCRIVVGEFELQSCYYVHFCTNTLGKGMNPIILPSMGLSSTTTVLLEGWIWH